MRAAWNEIGARARKLQTDGSPRLLGAERADFLWWELRSNCFTDVTAGKFTGVVEIYSWLQKKVGAESAVWVRMGIWVIMVHFKSTVLRDFWELSVQLFLC